MSLRHWLISWTLLLAAGCARTPGGELRDRMQVVEHAQQPQRLVEQARAFAKFGDFTRAEQYLRLAADAGADAREVTPLLVDVCVRDQRYLDAIQHAEAHLRRHPEDLRLRFVLGGLEAALGYTARARANYERVLSRDPANAEVHYALASVLRDDFDDASAADRHFREYLRLRPDGSHAEEARSAVLEVVP